MPDAGLEHGWRLKSGSLTWRLAVPADTMAMAALMLEMKARTGVDADCPDMFAPPVLITLVAEDESGTIVQGLYMEMVADLTMLGFHREGFDSAAALLPALAGLAYARRIRTGRVTTMRGLRARVRGMLEKVGFRTDAGAVDHWVFRVRD